MVAETVESTDEVKTVIIAIANHKGGVTKTTTTITVASGLARRGKRVLIIDLDGQANASKVVGKKHPKLAPVTICDVLLSQSPDILNDAIVEDTRLPSPENPLVHLIYGTMKLHKSSVENTLRARVRPVEVLADKLRFLKGIYDYILIDCPPALNILTQNALAAADHYIIPLDTSDQFGMDGMEDLMDLVKDIKAVNPSLNLLGILLARHDARKLVCKTIENALVTSNYPIFKQTISHATAVQQANMLQTTIVDMDGNNKVAREYNRLVKEIMSKLDQGQPEESDNPEDSTDVVNPAPVK